MDERHPYELPPYELPEMERVPVRPRWKVPLVLFVLTCASTYLVGGPAFAVALMGILMAHELGHYIQARRYGVPASLPYFLPMPLNSFGTMGAVIAMRPQVANRKALFDIAITGPLAGLVPSLVLSYIGLKLSIISLAEAQGPDSIGTPLVFQFLSDLAVGPVPEGHDLLLHPLAFAGWVGIFITSLNLIPIGQLDGGHIVYALTPKHAYAVSMAVLWAAIGAVAIFPKQLWPWSVMLLLLALIARHPPAANEHLPVDRKRVVLGCLALLFVIIGFTPIPMSL